MAHYKRRKRTIATRREFNRKDFRASSAGVAPFAVYDVRSANTRQILKRLIWDGWE